MRDDGGSICGVHQGRIETGLAQHAAGFFENFELLGDRRRVQHFRRREMSGKAFELQVRRGFQRCQQSRQIFRRGAEPPHARINLQMNRMLGHADLGGGAFHQLDMPDFPDRRCQVEADDFFFLAAPETGHQQNPCGNAFFTKRNRFVERSHTQPGSAFGLQRFRTFDRAMAVGVGLHHGADCHVLADIVPHGAVVSPKSPERDFRPRGTGRCPLRDFNGGHWRL